MTYRIFVSHTETDAKLAEAVTRQVEEAFAGQISLYLATEHILGGTMWKEALRKNIAASDAIISIITPEAIDKPWLYIEWSHFWLHDKSFFVLLSGDVKEEHLVPPMQDSQAVYLYDEFSIRKFLIALSSKVGEPAAEAAVADHASRFAAAVSAGRLADLERSISRYAYAAVLPYDDQEKLKILEYFFIHGDHDTFRKVFRRIDGDAFRADIVIWVSMRNDLEFAELLCEDIQSADHLCRVASALIAAGHGDARELRRVLDMIQSKNNAELRKLALEVLERGLGESDVFRYIVGIISNMAELRKVGMRLVERGEYGTPMFAGVVKKVRLNNRTLLRDIALEFVRQDKLREPEFEDLLADLMAEKPTAAIPVLEALKQNDPAMLLLLHERHGHLGPDNSAVAWLRKELGLE
ncbi:MAG TPA: toll/interleukin-1 receptor domain-containing protein [Longimicrobium sp.]|nr:toll/interleukin-1 receptor domain-containing protein [Longimicrobium sp.]